MGQRNIAVYDGKFSYSVVQNKQHFLKSHISHKWDNVMNLFAKCGIMGRYGESRIQN